MIVIRKSICDDCQQIKELVTCCFGVRNYNEILNNIDDRYYLLFDNDKLVAMTGLIYCDTYKGLEIDWSCTHPEYRRKGYMHILFKLMLTNIHESVYCSCWHLGNKEQVNLYKIMNSFNFTEVIKNKVTCKQPYNCFLNMHTCKGYIGKNCMCCEDLYLRKAQKEKEL